MRLRPHRRNLVVWSQSGGSAQWHAPPRSLRTRRIRRRIRIAFLLTIVTVRTRWPLLAGIALTAAGLVHRGGWGSVVLLPGLLLLLSTPLIPTTSLAERLRRSPLERELAAYNTTRQRFDLEATLDRYPDGVTYELREILTRQALAAGSNRVPGGGR
jgi:uncharacterized protein (DUF58 family)